MSMAKDNGLAMAKRIELWLIDRLVPYEKNARTHSPEQVAQLRASIQEFGFTNPILVDGKDGVIAGHGRLQAARDLGLEQVPVVVLDHLTPEQRRAYVIADNKLALNAGWDMSLLQQEVMSLNLTDFNLELLGFDEKELSALLDPEQIDAQEAPEEFAEVGDDIETDYRCPSCGYEWSGKTK
jgi:ParB-like chromosome segregation protein Spo0J